MISRTCVITNSALGYFIINDCIERRKIMFFIGYMDVENSFSTNISYAASIVLLFHNTCEKYSHPATLKYRITRYC